jgi:hypothetical protein
MGKSSGSARETGHKFPDDLEYEKKTTHSSTRKWDASSYRTKNYSDPEMITGENKPSETSKELTLNKHSNTRSRRSLSSLSRISSSPLHFGRVADELTTIQDIMTGIRNEVDAYSKLEHRYVHELEKKLPKSEGMGDIRMQLTVDQLEKIRAYRRNALDQLTEMNEKIAALEARVERIALEAEEAELNSKLQELEALYCISEAEAAPSVTLTAPEIIAPAPKIERPTKPHKVAEIPVEKHEEHAASRVAEAEAAPSVTLTAPEIIAPAPKIERPAQETIEQQVHDNSNSANVVQEKEAEIVDELQTLSPSTQMPNKQVQALRQLLGEYKKNNDPLSKSAMDNQHDHANATAFVDTSGGTLMEQQSLQDPGSETIEDLLREHAKGKRASISLGMLKLPHLKLPHNIHKKKKVLFAGGAGASVATGAWILESRSGMLSNALSNIMRMLG